MPGFGLPVMLTRLLKALLIPPGLSCGTGFELLRQASLGGAVTCRLPISLPAFFFLSWKKCQHRCWVDDAIFCMEEAVASS